MRAWLGNAMAAHRARQQRLRMEDLERRKAASPMYQDMLRWMERIQALPPVPRELNLTERQLGALKERLPRPEPASRSVIGFSPGVMQPLIGVPIYVVDDLKDSTWPEWTP